MKTVVATLLCCGALGLPAHSGGRLTMKVTPPVGVAPAMLTVRTVIEASPDNRYLEVVAESADYVRSSQISLDGDRSPRAREWVFSGLPVGRYLITATLAGERGQLASTTQWFQATGTIGR